MIKTTLSGTLGDRLAVGQQTLTLFTVVRIHVPQPRSPATGEQSGFGPLFSALSALFGAYEFSAYLT